ncbi:hypothetical protein EVAR_90187_1 [Eumeta japonica]|uniref:Uncharacterized protein n=1 Tax=Eumeta variegata TaxID=151549 RepID=A0A4C1WYP2_EUMVA|nr:hypothetical protein EVAR_90187_1 [Eumeta japonica]
MWLSYATAELVPARKWVRYHITYTVKYHILTEYERQVAASAVGFIHREKKFRWHASGKGHGLSAHRDLIEGKRLSADPLYRVR